jgi:predicted N-acyltransferase
VDTRPTDLPLAEMLRIMDVARTLRQEREIAQEQFNREEARLLLRQRLKASTEITGSQVTEAEIDAAIESYFNNLHTYHDPPWGVQVFLAHLYVRRVQVLLILIAAAVLAAGAWLLAGGRT